MLDMVKVKRALAGSKSRLIGPNCPGVITPDACKIGIMPGHIHRRGSGRHRVAFRHAHLRGGGADHGGGPGPVHLRRHRRRPGEGHRLHRGAGDVPGRSGDQADRHDRRDRRPERDRGGGLPCPQFKSKKPVVGFIAGATAPPGRRMGHAGAVISGGRTRRRRRWRRCAPPASMSRKAPRRWAARWSKCCGAEQAARTELLVAAAGRPYTQPRLDGGSGSSRGSTG